MDKLKSILESRGQKVSEEELRSQVTKFGFNPDALSDQEAETIAAELSNAGGLAIAPPKNGKRNGAKNEQTPIKDTDVAGFQKAALHAFKQKQTDLNAFRTRLDQHRTSWIANWVNDTWKSVNTIPDDAFEALKDKFQEEGANPETFSARADDLFANFVAANESSQTT